MKKYERVFVCVIVGVLVAGIFLCCLGIAANKLVMEANGGRMPVLCQRDICREWVAESPRHCLMTAQTRYPLLCDRFEVFHSIYDWHIRSIGDLLMLSGPFLAAMNFPLGIFFLLVQRRFRSREIK